MIKKIDEEKALLEADYLKIQMQTCLEEAKKKKEEEEQGQLVESHRLPSTDQQNQMENEVKNYRKLCRFLFTVIIKLRNTVYQF